MPTIVYKRNLKIDDYEQKICIAFDCKYNSKNWLRLKKKVDNSDHFDSGDFGINIDDAIKKLNYQVLKEYDIKNKEVRYLAILNYFVDEIPSIYYIKFESDSSESIYYAHELKKYN